MPRKCPVVSLSFSYSSDASSSMPILLVFIYWVGNAVLTISHLFQTKIYNLNVKHVHFHGWFMAVKRPKIESMAPPVSFKTLQSDVLTTHLEKFTKDSGK